MKIVSISDTHGHHREVKVPDGDVLIFAGDWTGSCNNQFAQLRDFLYWLQSLPHEHKVVVPGNHDQLAEVDAERVLQAFTLAGIHLLIDRGVEVDGLRIYGSPWTPRFFNWSFMKDPWALKEVWAQIPAGTDVLVTHGPPRGILDQNFVGQACGCEHLRARLRAVRPMMHIFGHIHEGFGMKEVDGTTFINAACWNHHTGNLRRGVLTSLGNGAPREAVRVNYVEPGHAV